VASTREGRLEGLERAPMPFAVGPSASPSARAGGVLDRAGSSSFDMQTAAPAVASTRRAISP
jgi:hypothetical protein